MNFIDFYSRRQKDSGSWAFFAFSVPLGAVLRMAWDLQGWTPEQPLRTTIVVIVRAGS